METVTGTMEGMDYSAYIFWSYAVALVSMAYLLISSLKKHKHLKRELAKAKPKKKA